MQGRTNAGRAEILGGSYGRESPGTDNEVRAKKEQEKKKKKKTRGEK
jgi:hypothetical protein